MKPSELLAKPEAWTQGEFARDREGDVVFVKSDEAVCWCMDGARMQCDVPCSDPRWIALIKSLQGVSPILWSDDPQRKHAEVVAKLQEFGL